MLNRNTKVRPLAEELAEIGLDPEKTIGAINRSTKLVEARLFGTHGGGAPSYLRPKLREVPKPKDSETVTEDVDGEGVSLSEALKVIKTKRLSSSAKAKGRRVRKKHRSGRRRAAKMYRKRMRRRIARVGKMKRKRYGTAGLAKLHKGRRKIMMQGAESPLANLREELNRVTEGAATADSTSYEDAAYNAGLLAMHLGEMFEAYGDMQSAETMYDASDAAADLSEALTTVETEADLTEEQSDMLERILDTMVKALRMYEAMGSPSLCEVIEFAEAKKDDDEDEDDDDDDGDEDDGEGKTEGNGPKAAEGKDDDEDEDDEDDEDDDDDDEDE